MSKTTNYKRMERLVEVYHQSGQSRGAFAKAHGITESKLYYWLRKLGKASPSVQQGQETSKKLPTGFIPITTTASDKGNSAQMIIRLGQEITIEIPISCLR